MIMTQSSINTMTVQRVKSVGHRQNLQISIMMDVRIPLKMIMTIMIELPISTIDAIRKLTLVITYTWSLDTLNGKLDGTVMIMTMMDVEMDTRKSRTQITTESLIQMINVKWVH